MDEYEVWEANCPLLYERISRVTLDWPSLTIDCFPVEQGDNFQRLVLGTNTSGEEENMLLFARLDLSGDGFHVEEAIPHNGEVNRYYFCSSSEPE